MRELFVWYRVRDERAAQARVSVRAMQRSLMAATPGLQARFLTRAGAGVQTWMEVYVGVAGIDAEGAAAIEAAARALGDVIDGDRHSEAFDADAAP